MSWDRWKFLVARVVVRGQSDFDEAFLLEPEQPFRNRADESDEVETKCLGGGGARNASRKNLFCTS